ncbi:DUF5956 family protein [Arthrobacter cheniae]|uniref:DUF5956 family protein n=1 Tax=Arthrobacter cheniae TaxID=1258888 RepID=UPI001C7CC8C4|nr:DUF5956 family protein [Arthrobacter cheniae]
MAVGARVAYADLASIDDDIDLHLATAGIPPLPRGYAWFTRRQGQCDTDATFWLVIN